MSKTISRAFVMIKPDGVARGLMGEIIKRFEQRGFRITKMQMLTPTKDLAKKHYWEHRSRDFFGRVIDYVSSGPVLAMVLEGPEKCIEMVRKMIGATFPLNADPGTIRGDFGIIQYQNIIHGSDSVGSAEREIELWFGREKPRADGE